MLLSDIKICDRLLARVLALDKEQPDKLALFLSGEKSAAAALLADSGPDLVPLATALNSGKGEASGAGYEGFVAAVFYWATWLPYCLTYLLTAAFYFNRKEPVLYSQTRFGMGAEPFRMYKFTTMEENPGAAEKEHLQKSAGDPGIIKPWGLLLRRTSLNELPQRRNLRAGEMAVFGPRPYPEKARRLMEELGAKKRSLLKPGWISLAHQVHNLYGISNRAMALIDILYVEFSITRYKRALDVLALKYAFRVITGARNK